MDIEKHKGYPTVEQGYSEPFPLCSRHNSLFLYMSGGGGGEMLDITVFSIVSVRLFVN